MPAFYRVESSPSTQARLLARITRSTIRPALQLGCHAAHLPWPYGAIERAAGLVPITCGANRSTVRLRNCAAELIRAPGVTADAERVILYCHGGGFLTCGPSTHAGLITRLSKFSNAPVLAVGYRMIPDHPVGAAVKDCLDAYDWLRERYTPDQIVFAGDSAGGYLTLALANTVCKMRAETPAALVMLSPLLQLDPEPKKRHPNIRRDAMFGPEAFDALISLVRKANGGSIYEPLDHVHWDLPPTLIHVSGHEALLHDARLAADRLGAYGIPVDVHVWRGQIHVFQIASFVPEASRSLKQIGSYIQDRTNELKECAGMSLTNRTATVG